MKDSTMYLSRSFIPFSLHSTKQVPKFVISAGLITELVRFLPSEDITSFFSSKHAIKYRDENDNKKVVA